MAKVAIFHYNTKRIFSKFKYIACHIIYRPNEVHLTLSDFRTYIYVRNPKTVATPVRIYIRTRTLRSKYGASNRHFTVSSHRAHEVFTCFRSAAGSLFTACLPTEETWSLVGVVRCFWRVLENYDCRTKFKSSLGMEYNGKLYGFSAVKVKLVDSLI